MELGKVIKTFTSKKGNQIVFRYPKKEDVKDMLEYINGIIAEDTFLRTRDSLYSLEEEQQYLDGVIEMMEKEKKFHIAVEVNGSYVGNGEISRLDHRQEHVGLLSIGLSKAFRGEGIGEMLLRSLIEFGKHMHLRLAMLHVFENNHRALHLYQKLGFRRAGMLPEAIFYKKDYIGEVTMYLPLIVKAALL